LDFRARDCLPAYSGADLEDSDTLADRGEHKGVVSFKAGSSGVVGEAFNVWERVFDCEPERLEMVDFVVDRRILCVCPNRFVGGSDCSERVRGVCGGVCIGHVQNDGSSSYGGLGEYWRWKWSCSR